MRGVVVLAVLAVCGPASAWAAAPTVQRAALHGGTVVLQAAPGRLDALRGRLRALGVRGAAMPNLGMVAVHGDAARLRRAAALPGVRYAHNSRRVHVQDHQSTPLIYGGGQQDALWKGGFDGRGVGVAVVDTGVDATHPDLKTRTAWNERVVLGDTPLADGAGATCNGCTTDASEGHGTHVSGIAVGDGTASDGYQMGVAPGASLYAFSTGAGPDLLTDLILQAFDDILELKQHGANILVVNNSWGANSGGSRRLDTTEPVAQATKKLHDAGVTVVFAAGNNGTAQNADRPVGASKCDREGNGDCAMDYDAAAPWVISVANARKDMDGGAANQALNGLSSRGDPQPETSVDGVPGIIYQPTLSAPGEAIISARATTGDGPAYCWLDGPAYCLDPARPSDAAYYTPMSGTSMAAPHVTGSVAVLQSAAKAKLGHYLTPDQVKSVLVRAATPMTRKDAEWDWPCDTDPRRTCGDPGDSFTGRPYESWQVGAGMVNVAAAVASLDPAPPAAVSAPAANTAHAGAGAAARPAPKAAKRPAARKRPVRKSRRRAKTRRRAKLHRRRAASHRKRR